MIEEKDSLITFQSVYDSTFAPNDTEFKDANLLVLPYQNIRNGVEYCFTEYASDFLSYLRKKPTNGIISDIAITDDNYCVLEMHSILLDIGIILVQSGILPVALNLLSNYIYDKIKSIHEKPENTTVRFEMVAQAENGISKSLKYDGPASELDKVEKMAKELFRTR